MNIVTTFDSTKEQLSDILGSIKAGKTKLPDFQRGWVWDDQHIRSLLASISRSFPVGAVMMLQTGNPKVRFKPREVEGAPKHEGTEPERLILDGQQRLTSLYQALFSGKVVETQDSRKRALKRWYYIDIRKALDPNFDREDAIVGLPEARVFRNFQGKVIKDFSTIEQECAADLLPLPLVFDQAAFTTWQLRYIQAEPAKLAERLDRWNNFVQTVVQPFQQYQVPLILLRKETPKEAVCQVFEKVNTGGVALTVFELLTATFAADNYNLRDDWTERAQRLRKHQVLRSVENTDLLQAITLLATYDDRVRALKSGASIDNAPGVSCKRRDVLQVDLEEYRAWADPVTRGFEAAAKFLYAQRLFAGRDLPYRTQLVPLAAAFAVLGDAATTDGAKAKLARWYWCGVFGELYGGAIESRFAKDLVDLVAWIRDAGEEPSTVSDANFIATRLLTLRTRNSAAYKGIHALLLQEGGLDFRTGDTIDTQTYFDEKIDVHHIFPQHWSKKAGIERGRYDSIVNKTPISARTNRIIGANAPTIYLAKMEKQATITTDRMDQILRSHLIDPAHLRSDSFDSFFAARSKELLEKIEKAMGKPVGAGGAAAGDAEQVDDNDVDDDEDEGGEE